MISYEFPLNERVRTLLRLEDLFSRLEVLVNRKESIDHHSALGVYMLVNCSLAWTCWAVTNSALPVIVTYL